MLAKASTPKRNGVWSNSNLFIEYPWSLPKAVEPGVISGSRIFASWKLAVRANLLAVLLTSKWSLKQSLSFALLVARLLFEKPELKKLVGPGLIPESQDQFLRESVLPKGGGLI